MAGIGLYAWLALACEATSGRHVDGGLCDRDYRGHYTGKDFRKNSIAAMENPATYLPQGSQNLDASKARLYSLALTHRALSSSAYAYRMPDVFNGTKKQKLPLEIPRI